MSNEKDGTAHEDRQLGFAIYDRLPPRVRRLIAYAPYKYVVGRLPLRIRQYGERQVLFLITEKVFRDRDATIKKHYGVTHPQYRQRPPGYEFTLPPSKKGRKKSRKKGEA